MSKRKAEEDCTYITELEIKGLEELTASVARGSPNVKTLKISCLLKATDDSGLPAHGMAVCHETALRIPYFLTLFPNLEEVCLGGYSKESERYSLDEDSQPFFFQLSKEGVQRYDNRSNINDPDPTIKVRFNLTSNLCDAYQTGFLSNNVKVIGLFDAADRFSEHNLLCEDSVPPRSETVKRDGKSCETCRRICQNINLQQALELKCAETPEDESGNYLCRLEFLGCQICIAPKTKFEVIMGREDSNLDILRAHLIKILSD